MAFDISKYKYELKDMPWATWEQAFLPQKNVLNPRAKFGGRFFEHKGAQWNYIVGKPAQQLWTLIQEDDGTMVLRNGLYVRGRKGYFYCERMHNPRELFRIVIPQTLVDENLLGD